jgi:hypothetical protein
MTIRRSYHYVQGLQQHREDRGQVANMLETRPVELSVRYRGPAHYQVLPSDAYLQTTALNTDQYPILWTASV